MCSICSHYKMNAFKSNYFICVSIASCQCRLINPVLGSVSCRSFSVSRLRLNVNGSDSYCKSYSGFIANIWVSLKIENQTRNSREDPAKERRSSKKLEQAWHVESKNKGCNHNSKTGAKKNHLKHKQKPWLEGRVHTDAWSTLTGGNAKPEYGTVLIKKLWTGKQKLTGSMFLALIIIILYQQI